MKILTFFNSLFEQEHATEFNPETGVELLPGTLLDVTGHLVGESDLNEIGPGVFGDNELFS